MTAIPSLAIPCRAGLLAAVLAASPLVARPAPADSFAATAALEVRHGRNSPDAVAGCFAATARHPSFAHMARYGDEILYRLRIDGLMFESIRIAPAPDGGTVAEIRRSASDARSKAQFEALRGKALSACLGAPLLVAGL